LVEKSVNNAPLSIAEMAILERKLKK